MTIVHGEYLSLKAWKLFHYCLLIWKGKGFSTLLTVQVIWNCNCIVPKACPITTNYLTATVTTTSTKEGSNAPKHFEIILNIRSFKVTKLLNFTRHKMTETCYSIARSFRLPFWVNKDTKTKFKNWFECVCFSLQLASYISFKNYAKKLRTCLGRCFADEKYSKCNIIT